MHICCVCTGNTCRSPMLAALLRQALALRGRRDFIVSSAGVAASPGSPASPHAITALAGHGIDLRAHTATPVSELDLGTVDLFCCMGAGHAEALRAAGVPDEHIRIINREGGGVPDPYGGPPETYRACAAILAVAAEQVVDDLT